MKLANGVYRPWSVYSVFSVTNKKLETENLLVNEATEMGVLEHVIQVVHQVQESRRQSLVLSEAAFW